MIGKEPLLVTPTCPMMGVLTPRKVTIQRNLVVNSSSNDDDLPLVRHDGRVHLNPGSVKIHHIQEPALLAESPLHSPPANIESILSNPAPRMERQHPPKIHCPLGTMEFNNGNIEEEREEPSGELVATLKQKIVAYEYQVTELHLPA
jgi:hypothetical protein